MKQFWKILLVVVPIVVAVKLVIFPEASEFSRFTEALTRAGFVTIVIAWIGFTVAPTYVPFTKPPGGRLDGLYQIISVVSWVYIGLFIVLVMAVVAYVKLSPAIG